MVPTKVVQVLAWLALVAVIAASVLLILGKREPGIDALLAAAVLFFIARALLGFGD